PRRQPGPPGHPDGTGAAAVRAAVEDERTDPRADAVGLLGGRGPAARRLSAPPDRQPGRGKGPPRPPARQTAERRSRGNLDGRLQAPPFRRHPMYRPLSALLLLVLALPVVADDRKTDDDKPAETLRHAVNGRFLIGTAVMSRQLDNAALADLIARQF